MSCVKKKELTEDKAVIIKTMEGTTPELGPVRFWSPKSSSFSGSDSIVVEEAARNFLSPRPSIKQSDAPNFFQHDKVEDSKLRHWEVRKPTAHARVMMLDPLPVGRCHAE